jgi:hypothetical protein
MKTKDYLIVALAPLLVLLVPSVGVMVSEEWNWTLSDFVVAWVLLAGTTFTYRLLATRKAANFAYRAGAGLAVAAGFLLTWVNLAVQVIGHENPANNFYFGVVLIGLVGAGLARFQPAGMAMTAFATAAATLLVPVIAFFAWPTDFSPGVGQVFSLNLGFVLLFAGSGLLFRHAAGQLDRPVTSKIA